MRYFAPLLFIGLFALGIHFVNKSTPLMDGPEGLEGKALELQNKLDEKFGDAASSALEQAVNNANDPSFNGNSEIMNEEPIDPPSESDIPKGFTLKGKENTNEDFEQDVQLNNNEELEEYSEEVSDEDFSEFLGAALEEISEDPEMARAIVVEMAKIYKVQPDHQEKIIQFYEDCANSPKLPNEIKNMCDREKHNLK